MRTDRTPPWPHAALGLALLIAAWPARAEPTLRPTLKTIEIDGDLSDWDPVLLNPLQVTLDGDGASLPCAFSTDRDCPVEARGRDLRVFAWTHDSTYLYLYAVRQGSSSNSQAFWLYFDLDLDQRMGVGDKVLNVTYHGSSGSTSNDLYAYLPVAPAGDPLVGDDGFADGHTLPGDLDSNATWSEGAPDGGSADGRTFEERIPWAQLGVPPGTPIHHHLASSGPSSPSNLSSKVEDNAGAPSGGLGSLGYDLVEIVPDRAGTVAPGATIAFAHEVTNGGNRPAVFALRMASSLGLHAELEADTDGDGLGDELMATDANGDGDFLDVGDFVSPAWDSDGDQLPDTGPLAPQAGLSILVTLQTVDSPLAARDSTTVTAFLPEAPATIVDRVTDTTDVGAVIVRAEPSTKSGVPGQLVTYALQVCNNAASDTVNLRAFSAAGWSLSLRADPACTGDPGAELASDETGDGSWDVLLGGDSDADGDPDTGLLAPNRCACLTLQVGVPAGAAWDTVDRTRVEGTGDGGLGSVTLVTRAAPRLEFTPNHLIGGLPPDRPALINGSNQPVYFAHTLRNNWGQDDRVELSALYEPDVGWAPPIFWPDPDGDGSIRDCFPPSCAPIDSLLLPANGTEDVHLVVEVFIPPDQPKGMQVSTAVSALSTLPGGPARSVVDQLVVSNIATYSDAPPPVGIATTIFAPCDTIYVHGETLLESDNSTYTLVYADAEGRTVQVTRPFITDFDGVATDDYTTMGGDAPGLWTIELRDERALTIGTVRPLVQGQVALLPFRTLLANQPLEGGDLAISALLFNTGLAALGDTTLDYVVLDPTGASYLRSEFPASSFQPYSGIELTHSTAVPDLGPGASWNDAFTVPRVSYPARGVYSLRATWRGACPTALLTRTYPFFVGLRWASFADAARSVPNDAFPLGNRVHMSGDTFDAGVAYEVAYYDPEGNRKDRVSYAVVTDFAGVLRDALDTTGVAIGSWTAAVYRSGASGPPGVFDPADPELIIADSFEVSAARDTTPPVFTGDRSANETTACPDAAAVRLEWEPAIEALTPPVRYEVYRSRTAGFLPTAADRIATGLTDLTHDDTSVACGATYWYLVRARDSADPPNEDGNLDYQVLSLACPGSEPPAPLFDELRVGRNDDGHAVLDWSRWTPAPEVTHAHVHRAAGAPGPSWTRISGEEPGATFVDVGDEAADGWILFYVVRPAVDCLDTESDS